MTSRISTTPMNPARMRAPPRYLIILLCAPPALLSDPREVDGVVLEVRGPEHDPAEVVVVPGAVGPLPDKLAVVVRQPSQYVVEVALAVVEQWGHLVELIDHSRQRRPRVGQQVGDRCRSVVERYDRFADRIAVR